MKLSVLANDQEADAIYADRPQAPHESESNLRAGIFCCRVDACCDQLPTQWNVARQLHVQHYSSITSPRSFILLLVAPSTIIHTQISTFPMVYRKTRNQASLRHHYPLHRSLLARSAMGGRLPRLPRCLAFSPQNCYVIRCAGCSTVEPAVQISR